MFHLPKVRVHFGISKCWSVKGRSTAAATDKIAGNVEEFNFSDHVSAFGCKTRWELLRALTVLRLCSSDLLVDNSQTLLRWCKRFGGGPLLRSVLYDQFVGGDSAAEVRHCMRRLASEGIRPMLATTMEEDLGEGGDESVYERNCIRILDCIKIAAAEDIPSPMVQLKLSGLLSADLLVTLGNIYTTSSNKLELVMTLTRCMMGAYTKKIVLTGTALNEKEESCLLLALQRLKRIADEAQTQNVRILVDAEYTYHNPGLSLLTLATVATYNKQFPLFWNTYQCYLKNAEKKLNEELPFVLGPLEAHFGAKIVRGAYMVQEKIYAEKLGIEDPVCKDYATTCKNYNTILSYLLDKASEKGSRCEFIIASHNEDSVRFASRRMAELNINRRNGGVCFGQLYGMGDHITNPLANSGFAVYKSIAIGSLDEVLPYLARRAIENRSVVQGARRERALLRKELRRRFAF
ncbi:hydroxyproline dehydrogenase-like [Uloborus diversus]|uniref:hydroxyproline dehydrogenase-like n=1 Tax=Uloborus diversus TaxID=327109 RepID=UPI0024098FB5|nr:hydroxyproline dehydrogenase-like [Uloborus diversus]